MPGHVKAGKAGEKDPDPEPYLVVTMDMKREDQKKPYDSKKSYWCPDGSGGYAECMLENKGDVESTVMMGHIVRILNFCIKYHYADSRITSFSYFLSSITIVEKGFQDCRHRSNQSTKV